MPRTPEESLPHRMRPWLDGGLQTNAIASADFVGRYPALCFERGDEHGKQFIPRQVIEACMRQSRLTVALWQSHDITLLDIARPPLSVRRKLLANPYAQVTGWCAIQRYTNSPQGAVFVSLQENLSPTPVSNSLAHILYTPLGQLPPAEQTIITSDQPLERVILEFPAYREDRSLPLDTSISVLANIATQEYLNTIYGQPGV